MTLRYTIPHLQKVEGHFEPLHLPSLWKASAFAGTSHQRARLRPQQGAREPPGRRPLEPPGDAARHSGARPQGGARGRGGAGRRRELPSQTPRLRRAASDWERGSPSPSSGQAALAERRRAECAGLRLAGTRAGGMAAAGLCGADFSDLREIKKQLLSVAERSRERGLQHSGKW